jgi:hypothetical protein
MDCSICAEKTNQSTRALISCFKCNFSACKSCVRKYLATSDAMPQCMNCHTMFNFTFLVKNLNQNWVLTEYKKILSNVILSSELGKIPETLPYAEIEKQKRNLMQKNAQLKTQMDDCKTQLRKLANAYTANGYLIRGEQVPHRYMNNLVTDAPVSIDIRKKFIMQCPGNQCKGFLSTAYKCGLCDQYTCKDCLVIKTDENHTCNENDKLSAVMIRESTKPCPKCRTPIYKIDGCDQMFCMARDKDGSVCQTVFSWKSGLQLFNVDVHNPHYFALQRENGYVPRNARDIHCGGMPELQTILQLFRYIQRDMPEMIKEGLNIPELDGRVRSTYRRVSEHIQYVLPRYRTLIQRHPNVMREHRINYILSKTTKEEFAEQQYRSERDYYKNMDILHTYELIGVCGIETFQNIIHDIPTVPIFIDCCSTHPDYPQHCCQSVIDKLDQFYTIIQFCNEKMKEISVTYNISVNVFDRLCSPVTKKFNISGNERRKKINNE